jgi:hypothetical protein
VALLQLPYKTKEEEAKAAAECDINQPGGGSDACRAEQLARHTEPVEAQCMPHVDAESGQGSRHSSVGSRRGSRRKAGEASVTTAEQQIGAANCIAGGQGGGDTAAAAAAAAKAAKALSTGTCKQAILSYAWLGQLHVSFVQLPQKAPPRLAA